MRGFYDVAFLVSNKLLIVAPLQETTDVEVAL